MAAVKIRHVLHFLRLMRKMERKLKRLRFDIETLEDEMFLVRVKWERR